MHADYRCIATQILGFWAGTRGPDRCRGRASIALPYLCCGWSGFGAGEFRYGDTAFDATAECRVDGVQFCGIPRPTKATNPPGKPSEPGCQAQYDKEANEWLPPREGIGPITADPAHPFYNNPVAADLGVGPTYRVADLNNDAARNLMLGLGGIAKTECAGVEQ